MHRKRFIRLGLVQMGLSLVGLCIGLGAVSLGVHEMLGSFYRVFFVLTVACFMLGQLLYCTAFLASNMNKQTAEARRRAKLLYVGMSVFSMLATITCAVCSLVGFFRGKEMEYQIVGNRGTGRDFDTFLKELLLPLSSLAATFGRGKVQTLKGENPARWYADIKTMLNIQNKGLTLNVEGVNPANNKAIAEVVNRALCQVTTSLPPLNPSLLPTFLPAQPTPEINPWEMYIKLKNVQARIKSRWTGWRPGKDYKGICVRVEYTHDSYPGQFSAEGHVPTQWRRANVVPLPKTNPPVLSELRPVSLTPILAKVCESFVSAWTLNDIKHKIDKSQFGCVAGKSTTHCLVDIVHHLSKTSDRPSTVSTLIQTDFAKAFDRVDHTLAVSSLLNLGLRPALARWIISFLSDRKQQRDNMWSPPRDCFGTLSFLALINSAAENATSNRWKFVDDLNLIESRQISGNSTIQHDLDELNNWSTVHRMQLHPKKCKVMYLHFSRTVPPLPPLKIDDHPLQEVKVAKLLGLHLQADLRWDAHVDYMVKKGGTRLFLLRKLKTFRLSIEDLLTIYTSYVRPVCEYAVPAWHPGLTQAQRNQLERIQRRAVRTILGKNYTNYADACLLLGLETLERRRDHLCLTFAKKLLQSPDYRHWFPPRRGDISGRTTRSSNQIDRFRTRTERFRNSALPYMVKLLNNSETAM
ncbi:hypothetical protein Bbelb_115700 [Branchiostoma belcheri]|nr:hypothetical protein Bbelb_115700 [Branchiostoma belcheri]